MSEHRRIPDWEWLTELLSDFDITHKRSGTKNARDVTSLEATLYTELQKRYTPRKKPNRYVNDKKQHTSKEYEDSLRIHSKQVETMKKMGYGLMLDGFTFYKFGYELVPWNFETNFTMHHAYEIHQYLSQNEPLKSAQPTPTKNIQGRKHD